MTEKNVHDTNVRHGNAETPNRGPILPAPDGGALALLLRWVDYLLGRDAVVVPVYGKRPIRTRWQTNGVKTIAEAKRLIRSGHATGMGLLLSDQFCSVDLDNAATARGVLKAEGIECDVFGGVAIVSRLGKERHLFSAPPSLAGASPLALRRRTGEVTARGLPKVETVLEFRIGRDQQDLLPGSIHPETLAPYHGLEPPEGALPEPPEAIVRIFLAGGAGILRMQRQHFGEQDAKMLNTLPGNTNALRYRVAGRMHDQFNARHTVQEIIERHNFCPAGNRKWTRDDIAGNAGLSRVPGKEDLWREFNANSPLYGLVDSWTAHVILDHEGNHISAQIALMREIGFRPIGEPHEEQPEPEVPVIGEAVPEKTGAEATGPAPSGVASKGRAGRTLELLPLTNVVAKRVEWVWRNFFARGYLTIIFGDGGDGKSSIARDLCARLTSGLAMPDGTPNPFGGEPVAACWASTEEGLADAFLPAFGAAGGDRARIFWINCREADGAAHGLDLSLDVAALRDALLASGAKILVLDALMGMLGADQDGYKEALVRRVLTPLAKLAEELGICVIPIMHTKKGKEANAVHQLSGSIAFGNLVRIVLRTGANPDDRDDRSLMVVKSNLGPVRIAKRYRMGPGAWTDPKSGLPFEPWIVHWTEGAAVPVDVDAETVPSAPTGKTEAAKRFILRALAFGPVESVALKEGVLKYGVSGGTYDLARKQLTAEGKIAAKQERGAKGTAARWLTYDVNVPERRTLRPAAPDPLGLNG